MYAASSMLSSSSNVAYVNKSTGSRTERNIVLIPVSFNCCIFCFLLSLVRILKIVTFNSSPPTLTSASARALSRSDSALYQYARYSRDFKYLTIELARPEADSVKPSVPSEVTNVASSV